MDVVEIFFEVLLSDDTDFTWRIFTFKEWIRNPELDTELDNEKEPHSARTALEQSLEPMVRKMKRLSLLRKKAISGVGRQTCSLAMLPFCF